ncbi:MAG: hypothetical protein P8166_03255 [Candidatus Thiodiazotropha sp.]
MNSKALAKLIKRRLFPAWLPISLNRRVRVAGTKILKIVHTRTQTVEYHGLIQVLPANKVEGVMERINQTRIGDRQLQSHPYSRRFVYSDRRREIYADREPKQSENRQLERRRSHLVCQVVDASL